METKVSVVSIIIQDRNMSREVNSLLHEYGDYIIGRMGIPYHEKDVNVICVVMDAPADATSALSGKLGMLRGVSSKTVTAKL